MSSYNRAQRLNARAVEKLSSAIMALTMDRLSSSEPNMPQIIADVLSGKPAATLSEKWTWKSVSMSIIFGLFCLVMLVIFGPNAIRVLC